MQSASFAELIARLRGAQFEFVVIGGFAAIVHGSSQVTVDFDVAAPFTLQNCARLLDALTGLHPRHAHTVDKRPLTQSADELATWKNLYLLTDYGRLDVLSRVDAVGDYEQMLRGAVSLDVFGAPCRVMSLDDLILVKAALARPKDKAVELELRAIREAQRGPVTD